MHRSELESHAGLVLQELNPAEGYNRLYVERFVSENVLQGSSSSAVGRRVLLHFGHMSSVISTNYDDKVGSFS